MAEDKKTNLNKEEKVINSASGVSLQKNLPQRPLPARPEAKQLNEQKVKNDNENQQTPQVDVKQNKAKKRKQKNIDKATDEESSKSKISWKKLRVYIIASIVGIVIIGIVILSVILSIRAKENEPLIMQNNATVSIVAFNGQYFLEVPENEEAYYYVFELTSDEIPVLIFSKNNQIDVSQYFNQQAIFNIRYYVQKESDLSRSQPSLSVEYVPQKQLSTPILRLNEELNKLEWNYVLNAGSYVFYYANGENISTFEYFPPYNDEDNIGNYMPELDFGVYNISIVAKPLNALFYTASEQSNIIVVNNFSKQEQVVSASYSLTNQTIFIDASNLEDEDHNFAIYIGEQILYFSPTIKQDTYEIDVTQHGLTILLGNTVSVVTLGSGEYLLDSEPKICVSQN